MVPAIASRAARRSFLSETARSPTAPGVQALTSSASNSVLDGRRFTAAATHQRLTSWHMEDVLLGVPARAAYVRLVWHDPAKSGAHFSVFELEAY